MQHDAGDLASLLDRLRRLEYQPELSADAASDEDHCEREECKHELDEDEPAADPVDDLLHARTRETRAVDLA